MSEPKCVCCDDLERGNRFAEIRANAEEILEYVRQNPSLGFCVNWARVRVEDVLRVCDRSGTQSWQVLIAGGQDNKLEVFVGERLAEKYGAVEVRAEW